MKLDEGLSYEKLSLDITPLIDIVFLLVLFFAVSTSFISGEDLEALKSNLLSVSDDKSSIETELNAANIRLDQLDLNIVSMGQLRDTQSLKIRMLEAKVADETTRNEQLETRAAASGSELDEANSRYDQVYSQFLDERTLRRKQEQVVFELEDLLAEKKEEVLELGSNLSAEKLAGEKRDDELASTQTVVDDLQVELDKYKKIAELDHEQIDRVLRAQQGLESLAQGRVVVEFWPRTTQGRDLAGDDLFEGRGQSGSRPTNTIRVMSADPAIKPALPRCLSGNK